ncbi:MAG: NrsF family protein [Terracidiphilus sp.]
MKEREIDEVLARAAQDAPAVPPAMLESIAGSIKHSLCLVRPIPAAWLLTTGLILIAATVALAGAARAGFYGIERLTFFERVLIFPVLVLLLWASSAEFAASMVPGSRRRAHPGVLMAMICLALIGVFALVFRDHHTTNFVSAGIACLVAGVALAIPAALLSWLLLRRGFAVNPVAAGAVAGTLAGLAGVTMLELHCPNFQVLHVLVWHTAVVPVAGAAGAFLARVLHLRGGFPSRSAGRPK